MPGEPFTLDRTYRPKRQKVQGENNPNTRQSVLFAGILLNAWFPAPNSLERHGRAGTFTLGSSATYFVVATVGGYGQWSQAVSLCLMLAGAGLTALAFRPYRPSSGP